MGVGMEMEMEIGSGMAMRVPVYIHMSVPAKLTFGCVRIAGGPLSMQAKPQTLIPHA